jgi:hypothetical protein
MNHRREWNRPDEFEEIVAADADAHVCRLGEG